jgi:catechol 2,3-dioxygenase-like lactoylglutathione lyase family enzyme
MHALVFSPEADEVRTILREAFGWEHVDAGDGWPIFAAPPTELGVHPGEQPGHSISLMCDDLAATMEELGAKGIEFGPVEERSYGMVTTMLLPGGLTMMLYEPTHPTAH